MTSLSEEREAFNKAMRAKAILMAVEWAGSAGKLAEMIGYNRRTGYQWIERVNIPAVPAMLMERLPGFPVKAFELLGCADKDLRRTVRQCPHCFKVINHPQMRTGYSPSFNDLQKRLRKRARAKASAKRKSEAKAAKRKAKTTP